MLGIAQESREWAFVGPLGSRSECALTRAHSLRSDFAGARQHLVATLLGCELTCRRAGKLDGFRGTAHGAFALKSVPAATVTMATVEIAWHFKNVCPGAELQTQSAL